MNIDLMLFEDTRWLARATNKPVNEFVPLAKRIQLRQSDWSKFWKFLRNEI